MNFEPAPELQEVAEAYSLDLVDIAKDRFQIDLDWSDQSIAQVERIAASLNVEYLRSRPTADEIAPFWKALGSYIGEVFRRNHGAEWGWVTYNDQRFPGMRQDEVGLFWPWGKAQGRIVNGVEDDLWVYYQVGLLKPIGVGLPPTDPSLPK